jgi:hypothetical protein
MNRHMKNLSVIALVAMMLVLPTIAAANVDVNVVKLVVMGGRPGTYVSIWQGQDAAGQPTGTMESVTPISPSGQTEVFAPWSMASSVYIWDPNKGYTFLQTVTPTNRGDLIMIAAK